MTYTLIIAIKALDTRIYQEQGETESVALIPALYDELATTLSANMRAAGTKAETESTSGVVTPVSPKITLVTTTHYDDVEDFAVSLGALRLV